LRTRSKASKERPEKNGNVALTLFQDDEIDFNINHVHYLCLIVHHFQDSNILSKIASLVRSVDLIDGKSFFCQFVSKKDLSPDGITVARNALFE
jgi:hypothetical protein